MDLAVPSRTLADMLSWVARSIPSRPTVPVLAGVVLRVADDALTIEATDLERTFRTRAAAEVTNSGAALVPGRLLAQVARLLPDGPARLRTTHSEVLLEGDGLDYRFARLPLEDYPAARDPLHPIGAVSGPALADAAARVLPAAGRDELIPVFTGIEWHQRGDRMHLSATDRYRMATTSLPWESLGRTAPERILVSARLLADVVRGTPPERYEISCSTETEGQAATLGLQFVIGPEQREVRTRLLAGRLPDLSPHLEASTELAFWVETDELRAAVGRVLLTVEDRTPIQLTLDEAVLTLSGSRPGSAQGRATVAIAALDEAGAGGTHRFGFNPRYLLDGLSGVRTDLVRIGVASSTRTVIVHETAHPGGAPDPDHSHLLKLMRLPASNPVSARSGATNGA